MFKKYKYLQDEIEKQNRRIEQLEKNLTYQCSNIVALEFLVRNPKGCIFKNTLNKGYVEWEYKFYDNSKGCIKSILVEIGPYDKNYQYNIDSTRNEDKIIVTNKITNDRFIISKSKEVALKVSDIMEIEGC